MIIIKLKPLSINEAWKFRTISTEQFDAYKAELYIKLTQLGLNADWVKKKQKLFIRFEFGVSNPGADYDNFIKVTQDVIASRYEFNDSKIFDGFISKRVVKKGHEYIKFWIYDELSPETIDKFDELLKDAQKSMLQSRV